MMAEAAALRPAKGKGKGGKNGRPPGVLAPPPPQPKGKGGGPPPPKAPAAKATAGFLPKAAPKARGSLGAAGDGGAAPFQRKLYWKPLDMADTEGTIFSDSQRERTGSDSRLDIDALTRMFEAEKARDKARSSRSSVLLSKAQLRNVGTKLLSDHRARNIAIILKRLPVSTKELTNILKQLSWEAKGLSTDDLEQILEVIPTKEEAERLREYNTPESRAKLRDVEQMVLPLALLSRSAARVRLLCIARGSRVQFGTTTRTLASIRAACTAIQKSATLREVMLLALDLGNYINHGDSSKGAKAISVGSLITLRDFKTGRMSTLHFLCASLLRSNPSRDVCEELAQELKPALNMAKIQVQSLQSAIRNFLRDYDVVKAECTNFVQEYASGAAMGSPRDKEGPNVSPSPARSPGRSEEEEEDDDDRSAEEGPEEPEGESDEYLADENNVVDATRWMEDVMKIRGSASRRLRCMKRVVEKLCQLMREDLDRTSEQAHSTLRFCGMAGHSAAAAAAAAAAAQHNAAAAKGKDLPADLEVLLQQLAEFVKVFKSHWDDVRADQSSYAQFFGGAK